MEVIDLQSSDIFKDKFKEAGCNSETHQFHEIKQSIKAMLIVTVVQHHNSGINSLLDIHHILGKLNSFARVACRVLRNHQCGPRPKKFGDP